MASRRPWKLTVGGIERERAATLRALQGKRKAGFWIRHRRGRSIQAWNERTGEAWRYVPRGGWFKIRSAQPRGI